MAKFNGWNWFVMDHVDWSTRTATFRIRRWHPGFWLIFLRALFAEVRKIRIVVAKDGYVHRRF